MEQTARLDNKHGKWRLCLDDSGNVRVEQWVEEGGRIGGRLYKKSGWVLIYRQVNHYDKELDLGAFRRD
jgi:hypothetical protein